MDSYPSLNPLTTTCIREVAEEARDIPSLRTLGLVLDKMELRRTGFVTSDVPLFEIRAYIERRIAAMAQARSSGGQSPGGNRL